MRTLLLLMLLPFWVVAQQKPDNASRVNFVGYRGNQIVKEIPIAPADQLLPFSVKAYETSVNGSPLTKPQPTIIRQGLKLIVRFASSDNLPAQGWVEVKLGDQVRYAGLLVVSRNPVNSPPDDWLRDQAYQDLFTQLLLYLY